MKKTYSFYLILLLLLVSLCSTTSATTTDDNPILPTNQNYFPTWITTQVKAGYTYVAMERYNKNSFAIHIQDSLDSSLEYNTLNYYFLGTNNVITRLETEIYCPNAFLDTPDDEALTIALTRLSLLEEKLSKLLSIPINLSEQERTTLAKNAINRTQYAISKPLYTIKTLSPTTPTYNDYRPAGFASISITLKGSAQIKINQNLGVLPTQVDSLPLLKQLGFIDKQISIKTEDLWLWGCRSFSFTGTNSFPTDTNPKLYSFSILNDMSSEDLAAPNTWKKEPEFKAVWAIDPATFYSDFQGSISKIKKDCLRLTKLTKVNAKNEDLETALQSIYPWINYRISNPDVPAYNYQQHSFPEDFNDYDKYDYILYAEMNDDRTHVLVSIYFGN